MTEEMKFNISLALWMVGVFLGIRFIYWALPPEKDEENMRRFKAFIRRLYD